MIVLLAVPAMAENDVTTSEELTTTNEFKTEESYEPGFLTEALNAEVAKGFEAAAADEEVEYGRKVTGFASAPKFAGYFMSGYWYSGKEGAHSGDGFKVKNVRAIVSGTIFNDFSYLMQVQLTNAAFHMKDYWLEWKKYSEFQIKGGQFIHNKIAGVGGMTGLASGEVSSPVAGLKHVMWGYAGACLYNPYKSVIVISDEVNGTWV